MSFPCQKSNRDSFVIFPTAQSLIPLSYPSSISRYPTCSTALFAQPTAAQWVKEAPEKVPFVFTNIAAGPYLSQFYPFNITSPQQVSYHPFSGTKYFYTFVNSPMHATDLTHHSLLDFVSLILLGKPCTLLCHSVHYQMPQNIKNSVNPQKVQHFWHVCSPWFKSF